MVQYEGFGMNDSGNWVSEEDWNDGSNIFVSTSFVLCVKETEKRMRKNIASDL